MSELSFPQFLQHFPILEQQYGFRAVSAHYDMDGFGSGLLRLESDRYFLDVQVDGMGPEVTLHAGRTGQLATDLAWIFAYLTRGLRRVQPGEHTWLYYFPHFTLNLWGEQSIAWQAARLADVLQPMWPAIFIFLDQDGPRSADFAAFQEKARRSTAERLADGYRAPPERIADRAVLGFADQAQKSFAFLGAYGFKVVHADPVFVRYETAPVEPAAAPVKQAAAEQERPAVERLAPEKAPEILAMAQVLSGQPTPGSRPALKGLYVNVFHRLSSYQVGVHTGPVQSDPAFELDFDLEELAAWNRVDYTPIAANRRDALPAALNRAARLFRRCAAPMLSGDVRLFQALHGRRVDAARRVSRAWAERDRGH